MPFRFRWKKKPAQIADEPPSSVTPSPSLPIAENNHGRSGTTVHNMPHPSQNVDSAAPSLSKNAALSAFKTALLLLGKAPLPGIGIATQALLEVVNGIQGMSQNERSWQQLTERMERLWYLVSRIQGLDGSEELCAPLIKEIKKLGDDLKRASTQVKLFAFFNNTDDSSSIGGHRNELDSIIIDLTATICAATKQTVAQLRDDFQKAISEVHAEAGSSYGMIANMTNNVADGIEGDFSADNKVYGKAVMTLEIHGNKFGHVGGSVLSHNMVENR